jgi:hypothetical protein
MFLFNLTLNHYELSQNQNVLADLVVRNLASESPVWIHEL